MINMIKIKLNTRTNLGDLTPKYDREADLLTVTSSSITEWTYGIDIDGTVIFDINENYIVENIDLLVREGLWEIDVNLKRPVTRAEAKIEIDKESVLIKSFNCPNLKVLTNSDKNIISLLFDDSVSDFQGIRVSKYCIALVKENLLLGFYIEGIKI